LRSKAFQALEDIWMIPGDGLQRKTSL